MCNVEPQEGNHSSVEAEVIKGSNNIMNQDIQLFDESDNDIIEETQVIKNSSNVNIKDIQLFEKPDSNNELLTRIHIEESSDSACSLPNIVESEVTEKEHCFNFVLEGN